jgi:hypothetical protein
MAAIAGGAVWLRSATPTRRPHESDKQSGGAIQRRRVSKGVSAKRMSAKCVTTEGVTTEGVTTKRMTAMG